MRRRHAVLAVLALVLGTAGVRPAGAGDLFLRASFRARAATQEQPASPASPSDRTRSGVDRRDAVVLPQTHAIYLVPRDRADQRLDRVVIPRVLDGVGGWFRARMGRSPRFDRTSGGAHDVTYLRGRQVATAYGFDQVVAEVRARGFDAPHKRYVVFAPVSRGETCGESQYPLMPGAATGRFIVVWLDSAVECRARQVGRGTAATAGYTETIVAHEWLHTEGVVPMLAPRHCASHAYHTCTGGLWVFPAMDPEIQDVMFPFAGYPLRDKMLDRGRDDYLDHGWPHVRDLRISPFLG